MIRIALLIIAASFANRSFAQKSIEANSEIKSATIYLQGAVMVMHSTVNVPPAVTILYLQSFRKISMQAQCKFRPIRISQFLAQCIS